MEENSMIRMEEVKERKVEIVKDSNTATDSEKEIADKKEQERKERKFLFQLIAIFCTWVFLIILLMRNERKEMQKPKVPTPPPKVTNPKGTPDQSKTPVTPTKSAKPPHQADKPHSKDSNNKPPNPPEKAANEKSNANPNPNQNPNPKPNPDANANANAHEHKKKKESDEKKNL